MVLKVGYLTIDDGPTADFRRKVKILKEKEYPAIFFCRGDRLRERLEDVIFAIKNGYVIGNHSYDHTKFSKLSLKECFQQIRETDELIDEIYKKADVTRPAKLFRFPGGDKGSNLDAEKGWPEDEGKVLFMRGIQNYLKKLGYHQPIFENITYEWYKKAKLHLDYDVYWTYDTRDWQFMAEKDKPIPEVSKTDQYFNIKQLKERMDEDVPEGCRGLNYKKSSDIILLHDYVGTEYLFEPLLEALSAKGLYFKKPIYNL